MQTVQKECREALGWSQAELAKSAGISQPLVSHTESGLAVKLLCTMQPALVARVSAALANHKPDAPAMRALAHLQDSLDADRKR